MLLLAGRPIPFGPKNSSDWKMCGDPIAAPGVTDNRLQVIPYPINTLTYLSINPQGNISASASIGPSEIHQVAGNLLYTQQAGTLVFECVPKLF